MRLRLQENTASRLVLNLQLQWSWVYWLFSTFFLVGACAALFFLARSTEFTCTRSECRLQQTIVFWSEQQVVPLDALLSANIKTDRLATTSTNELVIAGQERSLTLQLMAADVNTKLIYANQFNIFKRTPAQQTLTIQEDLRWLGFGLGSLLALSSFLCLRPLRTVVCALDTDLGKFVLLTKPLLSKPQKEIFDLAEIKTVDVSAADVDSGQYNVFVRFKDDQRTLIAGPFISANARHLRAYILTFLQDVGREVIL